MNANEVNFKHFQHKNSKENNNKILMTREIIIKICLKTIKLNVLNVNVM